MGPDQLSTSVSVFRERLVAVHFPFGKNSILFWFERVCTLLGGGVIYRNVLPRVLDSLPQRLERGTFTPFRRLYGGGGEGIGVLINALASASILDTVPGDSDTNGLR